MITLEYHISPMSPERLSAKALENSSEADLRYELFLGDIVFRINDADFSAQWDWVPVLDFALEIDEIVSKLSPHDSAELEFTESDSVIRFDREVEETRVSANYSTGVAVVAHRHLAQATASFRGKVIAELLLAYPRLRENKAMEKWLAQLDAPRTP